jgi:cellulose synthase/poly-beta-1,6-N-acetylglucosamine synthase-like glycosyltransferase
MNGIEIVLWLSVFLVVYTYIAYPLVLAMVARLCARPLRPRTGPPMSVSVIVAAHNEETVIEGRLNDLLDAMTRNGISGEVIVVSDASTDATALLARTYSKAGVRVLELPEKGGKAAALTQGCAAAAHAIIVFADTRQPWEPSALKRLLDNFNDPAVGAVSGDLVVESEPGVMAGVRNYWSFEKWLRRQESAIHSMVGVTGAISAVRRRLFRPIPNGTLLDDVYWPLQVAMQGYRVIHEPRAQAFDRLPQRPQDEFQRKVRTLTGNFQLVTRLPQALLPWRNPIWIQLVSHKLLRLMVPWALLCTLVLSALEPGLFGQVAFAGQALFYLVGLIGIWKGSGARSRLVRDAAAFLVLNTAAWLAFWVWLFGRADKSWSKVSYPGLPFQYAGNRQHALELSRTP